MLHTNFPRWTRPLLIALTLLASVLVFRLTRTTPTRIAPPDAIAGLRALLPLSSQFVPQSNQVPAAAATMISDTPVITTTRLRIVVHPGSFSNQDAASLAEPLENALTYVEQRTAMQLSAPVTIIFSHYEDSCALGGAAYTPDRKIYFFGCADKPKQRAINILAHEFVHQLAHDHYGPSHLKADIMLSEGLATWGAGRYWLGGSPDFRTFVAQNYGDGLLPLATAYDSSSADSMNRLYYQWAAFVDWLITIKGRPAFDELYRQGVDRGLGSAPYNAVLGTDLDILDTAWQSWIKQ